MTHVVFLIALLFALPALNKRIPFYLLTFTILFFFLALRYNYGNDYRAYYEIHSGLNNGIDIWGNKDILYRYLNLLVPNFYLFISIISLFYIVTVYFLIKNNLKVKQYGFAVFVLLINPYLFLIHLSSIRQTIAICFFVYAVHYAERRKLLRYLIFVAIAVGFHNSALVLLPFYFVITDKKVNKWVFVVIFVLMGLMLETSLFQTVVNRLLVYFPETYTYYVNTSDGNSLRATIIAGVLFLFIAFNINKLEGKHIIYGKLALISTAVSVLAVKLSMLTRLGMYFDIFLIIAIPAIFSKLKVKAIRQLLFLMIVALYALKYYSFFNNPLWHAAYSTYQTILSAP